MKVLITARDCTAMFRHWVRRQLRSSQADSVYICTWTSPASPSCPPRQQSGGFGALSSPFGGNLHTSHKVSSHHGGHWRQDSSLLQSDPSKQPPPRKGQPKSNVTFALLPFGSGGPMHQAQGSVRAVSDHFQGLPANRRLFWFSWLVQMKSPLPQDV